MRTSVDVYSHAFSFFPDDVFDFWLLLRASLMALGGSSAYLLRTNENVTFFTFPDNFLTFGCSCMFLWWLLVAPRFIC